MSQSRLLYTVASKADLSAVAPLPVPGAALPWTAKPPKISGPTAASSKPFDPLKLKGSDPLLIVREDAGTRPGKFGTA